MLTGAFASAFAFDCRPGLRLDPHTNTSALTPSDDWIKRYFSVAFSSYLSLSLIFYQSALGVKAPVSA